MLSKEELENINNEFVYHGFDHKIPFGKYKGSTIQEIGEIDSDYILWLYDNNIIKPNTELLSHITELIEEQEESREDYNKSANSGRAFWDSIFGE